jgi:hypothetical protein
LFPCAIIFSSTDPINGSKRKKMSWAWWCMPLIPALWRWRQEDQEFDRDLASKQPKSFLAMLHSSKSVFFFIRKLFCHQQLWQLCLKAHNAWQCATVSCYLCCQCWREVQQAHWWAQKLQGLALTFPGDKELSSRGVGVVIPHLCLSNNSLVNTTLWHTQKNPN